MKAQRAAVFAAALVLTAAAARADTVQARCDLTTEGGALTRTLPCTFSQRQGFIGIQLPDGTRHDLSPQPAPGRMRDAQGRDVRQRVLGTRGQSFALPDATLVVLWDRSGLPGVPFERALRAQGIAFRVESANEPPPGRLRVTPSGLSIDNAPIERPIDGHVQDAFTADLNRDGSPELYVVVRDASDRATLVAFSANRRKSMSDITVAEPAAASPAGNGWRGHDQYVLRTDGLWRRFPVYAGDDTDERPSGGVREIRYRLAQGEASWRLRIDRVRLLPARPR